MDVRTDSRSEYSILFTISGFVLKKCSRETLQSQSCIVYLKIEPFLRSFTSFRYIPLVSGSSVVVSFYKKPQSGSGSYIEGYSDPMGNIITLPMIIGVIPAKSNRTLSSNIFARGPIVAKQRPLKTPPTAIITPK